MIYRAVVAETTDPKGLKRIRVKCPERLGNQLSNWALPCLPPQSTTLPKRGDLVWVTFEGERLDSPVWLGILKEA